MANNLSRTALKWSEHSEHITGKNLGLYWWEIPEIRSHRNQKVSGLRDIGWVEYTLDKYFKEHLPIANCLSLGCGSGSLERELARLNAFQHCDAYDIASGSIAIAKDRATALGISNIQYYVANVNTLELNSNTYDAVWISNALHHFEALEHIFQQICKALKPEGLLILNEYIGPNRFQFPPRQKEVANYCLGLLPVEYRIKSPAAVDIELKRSISKKGIAWAVGRVKDKWRDGDLIGVLQRRLRTIWGKKNGALEKTQLRFPSVRDVVASDPTEAIRSQEIVPILLNNFEIVERRDLGGNILQFLLADIAANFINDKPESIEVIRMLINIEETLLRTGDLKSDFAYLVTKPRSG